MADFPKRLEYSAGNANDPGDPFGHTLLLLQPDGSAQMINEYVGKQTMWSAKVEPATVQEIWAALARGGFPKIPDHEIPGGSSMRMVNAVYPDGEHDIGYIAWHAGPKMPGFGEAFAMLDSIVRQISEDTIQATPNTLPPVVSDIVRHAM